MAKQEAEHPESWGEYPPELTNIPGETRIDEIANLIQLEDRANGHLEEHPHILKGAKESMQNVVAVVQPYGKVFLIGVGLAAIAGGVLIYRHTHHVDQEVSQ